MSTFHFLRPWWLLGIIPIIGYLWRCTKSRLTSSSWEKVCDKALLPTLLQHNSHVSNLLPALLLALSALFTCVSLSGPTWKQLPTPSYHIIEPKVIILDLSQAMLSHDLMPDKLALAKFKLQDLLQQAQQGQYGLVVFTGQPFTASPLTEDSETILALLPALNPDIMPVDGTNLSMALQEGANLIKQAGFAQGKLLVMIASAPDKAAQAKAATLAQQGIKTSVMPLIKPQQDKTAFKTLAQAGRGQLLTVSVSPEKLQQWAASSLNQQVMQATQQTITQWRDEGRWFLWPALLFLLPAFRRGNGIIT